MVSLNLTSGTVQIYGGLFDNVISVLKKPFLIAEEVAEFAVNTVELAEVFTNPVSLIAEIAIDTYEGFANSITSQSKTPGADTVSKTLGTTARFVNTDMEAGLNQPNILNNYALLSTGNGTSETNCFEIGMSLRCRLGN